MDAVAAAMPNCPYATGDSAMNPRPWSGQPVRLPPAGLPGHPVPPLPAVPRSANRATPSPGGASTGIEWKSWSRSLDRRRKLSRDSVSAWPRGYLSEVTRSSFLLDGIEVTERDLSAAMAHGYA